MGEFRSRRNFFRNDDIQWRGAQSSLRRKIERGNMEGCGACGMNCGYADSLEESFWPHSGINNARKVAGG